jgi:hypothetical protein
MEMVMPKAFPFCILLYSPPDLLGLCQPPQLLSSIQTELLGNWRGIRKYIGGESITADWRCGGGFNPWDCFLLPQCSMSNICILFTDASIVVSAPTGSGKTVIFELAIIRLLTKLEAMTYAGQYKIVYSK